MNDQEGMVIVSIKACCEALLATPDAELAPDQVARLEAACADLLQLTEEIVHGAPRLPGLQAPIAALFKFLSDHKFAAVEWDGELTAFQPNPRCDVHGEPGLEPFGESEFDQGPRDAMQSLERLLVNCPPFFLKAPPVRFPVHESLTTPPAGSSEDGGPA